MKREYILYENFGDYGKLKFDNIEDLNKYYSVRYQVDDDSYACYIMGVDVAEEPEYIKVQRKRDQKIDSILN